MTNQRRPRTRTIIVGMLRIAALAVVGTALLLQGYAVVARNDGLSPLPPLFGNFPSNRDRLEKQAEKDEFAFAVIGDTRGFGTFEDISEELRKMPLDFAVLLGDCSFKGTEQEHQYFRAEWSQDLSQTFPVFYVVGNHDVSVDRFPVARFEREYGPSIFSFEYQRCLFIVLRILNEPFSNEESLAFLKRLSENQLDKYQFRFVFMHIPPPISPTFSARPFKESEELVRLLEEMGVDYVFAGDFHGYARVKLRNTTYIVSGGGGGHLADKHGRQFHHAFVMRVAKDRVIEQIVPGSERTGIQDRLERLAIAKLWPWMTRNLVLVCVIDAVCLVVLFVPLKQIVARTRSKGYTR